MTPAATDVVDDVVVDAPDGAAALELEHRLARLGPVVSKAGDGWHVIVRDVDVAAVQREVATWLRLIGSTSTVIQTGEREIRVTTYVPTHGDFIG